MSERDDLLGKADALLKRYRGSLAADFPVLTEIIDPIRKDEPASSNQADLDNVARASQTESTILQLEERLSEQVLAAVESRIADLASETLQQHFSVRMSSLLDDISKEFAFEVRTRLPAIVQEAVRRAIERELAVDSSKAEKS